MRVKIRVGDTYLDTFSDIDDNFYITEQRYDIKSLEHRKAEYTRAVTVPRSKNNDTALNFLSNERNENPKFRCAVLIDDITFLLGSLLVVKYSQKQIEIIIFGGNFALFDDLPLKSVRDLDLSAYSFPWTQAGIGAIKTNTTGCTSVNTLFLDRDSLDDGAGIVSNFDTSFDIKNWGFGFYLKTLVTEVLNQSGYSVNFSSAITSDDLFNDIVILCPVILPGSTEDIVAGTVQRTSDYIYDASILVGVPDKIPFVVLSDPGAMWDSPNDQWVVPTSGEWQVIFDFTISNDNGADLGPCEIEILRNGGNLITKEYYEVSNLYQQVQIVFTATAGDLIYIECTGQYRNASRYDYITIQSGATFVLAENLPDPTGTLNPHDWLPEMNQRDLLMSFLKIFNCIISTNNLFNQTANILTWNEYVDSVPQDLTSNVLEGPEIEQDSAISTYYKESLFTYNNDSMITRTDTDLEIAFKDATLQQRGTILSQFFSACDGDNVKIEVEAASFTYTSASNFTALAGGNIFNFGQIEVFKPGDYIRYQGTPSTNDTIDRIRYATSGLVGQIYNTFPNALSNVDVQIIKININDITPRIGRIRRDVSVGVTAFTRVNAYTGSTLLNTPVNVVSFDDLRWSALGSAYYNKLYKPLQTPKLLRVWMVFNTVEFYNLDYNKPAYIKQFNGNYHINKVSQWKLNEPCLVELIRINSFT